MLWPTLYPVWKGPINKHVSQYSLSCWSISLSNTLDKKHSNAIGRISPIVRGDATLLSAKTSDFFHTEGKTDSRTEELKISNMYGPITGKASIIILFRISSCPLVCDVNCSACSSISLMKSSTDGANRLNDMLLKWSFSFSAVNVDGESNSLEQISRFFSSFQMLLVAWRHFSRIKV